MKQEYSMEIKRKLYLILLLFLFTLPVFAQNSNFYIDTESGFPRFIQRLSWSGGENALRYEVIIQRLSYESYVPHLVESTIEHFIEVSLPPGEYRFQVIPYDALNRPSEESEWAYIQVFQYYSELAEAEPEPELEPERSPEMQKLYDLMESLMIRIGVSWKPIIPLYGDADLKSLYSSGAEAHINIFSTNAFKNLNFGNEMTVQWYTLDNIEHNIYVGVYFFVLKWFGSEKYAFSCRIGGLFPIQTEDGSIGFSMGGTFHWRIFNNLLLEMGLDFSNRGMINPRAGFSLLF